MIYKHLVKVSMAIALSTGVCATMPMPIAAKEKTVVIGQETNADYSFQIVNQLKGTIKALRIKTGEEETFRANELTKKQAIKKNKSIKFNYTLFDGETEDTSFMMRIALSNGKIYTLTTFPMDAIHKKVYIKQKNGIVYLKYKNADGDYVSTYSREKAALTTVNEDGTETVESNETDKEEAKSTQSDVKSDTKTTSKPVTTDSTTDETSDTETTNDTQNKKSSVPVGGACSSPENCQSMKKSLDEASGNTSTSNSNTTSDTSDQDASGTDQ